MAVLLTAHEGAASLDAVDQTLLNQRVDRLSDSPPRQAMLLHKRGLRGHDPARRQCPELDLGAQDAGELLPERSFRIVVDGHKINVGIRARSGAVRVDLGQL